MGQVCYAPTHIPWGLGTYLPPTPHSDGQILNSCYSRQKLCGPLLGTMANQPSVEWLAPQKLILLPSGAQMSAGVN